MANFIHKIKLLFGDKVLRGRILFTLFILVAFRFLSAIPIPGIDTLRLEQFISGNDFFGLLNIFSGGGLSNLSIIMLGISPSITASIVMQLLTVMFPKLKAMYQEDGEMGRKKFSQYSRLLTVPFAFIQGYAFLTLLQNQGILEKLATFDLIANLVIITGGSLLLMWLGELISEFGVGNGLSLIIFAGIVSVLPSSVGQLLFAFDPSQLPSYVGFLAASLLVIWGVVVITEAERPIPVTYAKQVRGNKVYGGVSTYLPLRVNQAGVIPIIFALSILLFPQMIVRFLANVGNPFVQRPLHGSLPCLPTKLSTASLTSCSFSSSLTFTLRSLLIRIQFPKISSAAAPSSPVCVPALRPLLILQMSSSVSPWSAPSS